MSHDHDHDHLPPPAPAPVTPDDAGSQALAEALRSSFAIVKFAMLLMVLAFFASGFFTVGPAEKAVILRFGRPVGEGVKALLGAGLHWSFPYPIDEVVKIPITEIQSVDSTAGWYYMSRDEEILFKATGKIPPSAASLNPAVDGYVITADQNIVHTRATLYYHIADAIRYVFEFASASNTVQNALNNALLSTAARFNVDDILTRDVAGFQDAVLRQVSDLTEREQLGVVIDRCVVQSVAPRQLQDVFDQVTTARENRNKLLNDAHSYESQVLIQAGAQATTITNAAEADRARYVESITAEGKRFNDLLPKYASNPNLFAQQTFLQAVGPALTNADKWIQPVTESGKSMEVRLMLNREPPSPKTAAPNP
ncbi:MAG TPA: protease modulator HflK [Candidatus Acidoferrum sp.]|nr:protease modulator HflK [Candidatus Acidoferrum sp.]